MSIKFTLCNLCVASVTSNRNDGHVDGTISVAAFRFVGRGAFTVGHGVPPSNIFSTCAGFTLSFDPRRQCISIYCHCFLCPRLLLLFSSFFSVFDVRHRYKACLQSLLKNVSGFHNGRTTRDFQ